MTRDKPTSPEDSPLSRRWRAIRVESLGLFHWSVANFSIWIQRIENDWLAACDRLERPAPEDEIGPSDHVPLGLDWTRWAFPTPHPELRFAPAFPNRPLVVKTRSKIILPPNSQVELFIQIPIWVELSAQSGSESFVLTSYPSLTLSNTWFGLTSEGQLCYALPSRARRYLEDVEPSPLRAVCPFQLHNRSIDPIPVERIRIFPEHLAIYRDGQRLWTGAVRAFVEGPDQPGRVEYPAQPPKAIPDAAMLRPPLTPYKPKALRDSIAQYSRALFS